MAAFQALFKRKRTPEQVAAQLATSLRELSSHAPESRGLEKLEQEVSKLAEQMRVIVYGEPTGAASGASGSASHSHSSSGAGGGSGGSGGGADRDVDPAAVEELARACQQHEVMPLMMEHFKQVDFEARKATAAVFCNWLRHDVAGWASAYMPAHTALIYQMVDGYSAPDLALHCGTMVRECIKLPRLHEALLFGPDGGISKPLRDILETYVHDPNFEVAADAFETLTCVLTTNKPVVFKWLNPDGDAASLTRYTDFFGMYTAMMTSENYVLKRQSLKLLSEFLLDRENFRVMMRYISDKANMKTIMMMLRHKQPNIQFEAFHVFKVFVANPEKPADVAEILAANKVKLIKFLQEFQNEKDDEQFTEEKAMLVDTLMRMPDVVLPGQPQPAASSSSASTAGR